ncbi:MAG: prepilin-type N-terminal cleavage/methylation domain-containing protein [Patescibacteria group bacterium]|nr:prepilin-type N-terminal cleavage/methylation domain-containing protein [Patescibacteria group bacterium]
MKGFTLIEIILATFLFSSIVGFTAIFFIFYLRNYSFSFEQQQVVSEAQGAITLMMKEIRKIRNGDNGSWPLVQTDDRIFVFYSDVTNDGRTDRVRYFLDGRELKRGVIQPTAVPVTYPPQNEIITTIARFVEATNSAIFRYYNGNWPGDTMNNPLPPSQRILNTRFVEVTLTINPTQNFAAKPFQLSSGVSIRSMKTNL